MVGTELETQDRRMRRGVCQEKSGLIRSSTWASRTGTGAVRRTKNTYPSHLGREQNGRKLTVLGKSSADPALRFPALRNAGGRAKRGSLPRPCPALPCPGLPWPFYCVLCNHLGHPQPQCTASKSATEQRAVYNLSAQTGTTSGRTQTIERSDGNGGLINSLHLQNRTALAGRRQSGSEPPRPGAPVRRTTLQPRRDWDQPSTLIWSSSNARHGIAPDGFVLMPGERCKRPPLRRHQRSCAVQGFFRELPSGSCVCRARLLGSGSAFSQCRRASVDPPPTPNSTRKPVRVPKRPSLPHRHHQQGAGSSSHG